MTAHAQQAASVIRRHGTVGYLLRAVEVAGEFPWEPGSTQMTAYPCRILIGSFRGLELANTLIQVNDVRVLISAEGLQITPETSDVLQLSNMDRTFQILATREAMPAGVPLYYEVHAR
ncbi:hypothetical protein [Paracoccus endophyticus]|uniref:hypothetical protein n=1 Tax=Paracoccus endophyticus TaxID=2233774 RepID=UPI000DD9D954|nr:hypothetical protein [Paracoccus endophyticus]